MSKLELKDISLHLALHRSTLLPLKLSLIFSPRIWGNRSLFLIIDEKFLRYHRWEEDIEELIDAQGIDIGPVVAAVRLIKKAYTDVPFFKNVAKTIIHTKGANLTRDQFFELAETIELLGADEPNFRNVVVRQ